jgi:hypothetical protein
LILTHVSNHIPQFFGLSQSGDAIGFFHHPYMLNTIEQIFRHPGNGLSGRKWFQQNYCTRQETPSKTNWHHRLPGLPLSEMPFGLSPPGFHGFSYWRISSRTNIKPIVAGAFSLCAYAPIRIVTLAETKCQHAGRIGKIYGSEYSICYNSGKI